MARKCVHNETYICQICGECYPCLHRLEYDGEYYWWICRFEGNAHRTITSFKRGLTILRRESK